MFRAATASTTSTPRPMRMPQHSRGTSARACAITSAMHRAARQTSDFKLQTSDLLKRLNGHGDSHPATDAERGDAISQLPRAQRVNQRRQHTGAACANRMAERDRATVDVDLRRGETELAAHGQRLRGKRFVELEQIDVASRQTRA